jgi:hypothetical protein
VLYVLYEGLPSQTVSGSAPRTLWCIKAITVHDILLRATVPYVDGYTAPSDARTYGEI